MDRHLGFYEFANFDHKFRYRVSKTLSANNLKKNNVIVGLGLVYKHFYIFLTFFTEKK